MRTPQQIRSRWRRAVLGVLIIAVAVPAAVVFGYYAHQEKINPVYSFLNRVERKLRKTGGEASLTERLSARVETTFLRLRGTVYEQPENDFIRGGALTVWGSDLLVLNHAGDIFVLDEGQGLKKTAIAPPQNGLAAYIALSKTPDYADYIHKPALFRFNDILYVDTPELTGLVLSYTFFDAARACYGTRVSWLPLAEQAAPRSLSAAPQDWQTLFDTYPCLPLNPDWTALDGLAAGGRMAFQAPATLYLGSGDYHLDGIHTYDVGIQSDDTAYGKVMAIDLITKQARIVSKGHRNLQGVAIDKAGRLWVTEHGLRGGDELNLIRDGANYGWPLETLGTLYSGLPVPGALSYGRHDVHQAPVFAWLPSAAVSSLAAIDGLDPSWDGDLLAGSLSSEEFGQSLFHIRTKGARVVFVERIKLGRRVRYLTQFGADKIAVWLDTNELVIFTAERRADPLQRTRDAVLAQYDAQLAGRVIEVLEGCNQCHSFEQFDHAAAPSLNGVVGRRIAGTSFAGYSGALKAKKGVWDGATLKLFLADPDGYAPGTQMPATGLNDPALIDALIWALDQANTGDDTHMTYN
jgi:cytochrome c2